MTDNRVLNNGPPTINSEETLPSRRQRAALSQLCSGYWMLLNSYKKRLKQTDSSSCPDCGMDPYDIPYLFYWTVHPNDLSQSYVNLWNNPGNLDEQMRMIEEGMQQQSSNANTTYSFRYKLKDRIDYPFYYDKTKFRMGF